MIFKFVARKDNKVIETKELDFISMKDEVMSILNVLPGSLYKNGEVKAEIIDFYLNDIRIGGTSVDDLMICFKFTEKNLNSIDFAILSEDLKLIQNLILGKSISPDKYLNLGMFQAIKFKDGTKSSIDDLKYGREDHIYVKDTEIKFVSIESKPIVKVVEEKSYTYKDIEGLVYAPTVGNNLSELVYNWD